MTKTEQSENSPLGVCVCVCDSRTSLVVPAAFLSAQLPSISNLVLGGWTRWEGGEEWFRGLGG